MGARHPERGAPVADPRDQELRVLKTIAHALNGSLTLDEALSTTLDESARLFELETGWIWLLDPESEAPTGRPWRGASCGTSSGICT